MGNYDCKSGMNCGLKSIDAGGGFQGKTVRRSFLCARTRGEGMFTPSEAERNFADKKRAVWKLHSNVSKIPLQYQMVGGTRLELMTSAV